MLSEIECYEVGEDAGEESAAASEATVVERMGFVPDAWQARVLERGAKQGILNCARLCGKSTVTAVMAVEQAYTEAESLTLVLSGGDRPVQRFQEKIGTGDKVQFFGIQQDATGMDGGEKLESRTITGGSGRGFRRSPC